MTTIRAKFVCESVNDEPVCNSKIVLFTPVFNGSEENKSFAKLTPAGILKLWVSYETPASEAFEAGREYYLDISPA